MSGIQGSMSDFILAIDSNNLKGHEVLEITLGEGLFITLLTELQFDVTQGDLFQGYKEIPEYVKLSLPFGYLRVNRGEKI